MDNLISIDFANRRRITTGPVTGSVDPYVAAVENTISAELLDKTDETDPSAAADAQAYVRFAKLIARSQHHRSS